MSNAYTTARIGSASSKKLAKVKNKLGERELELFEARKQIKVGAHDRCSCSDFTVTCEREGGW